MLLDQLMFNTISATKAALKATWFCPGWSDVWLGRWKRNSSIGNSWKKQLQKRRIFFIWIILFICKIIPDKFKKGRKTLQNEVLVREILKSFSPRKRRNTVRITTTK